MELLGITDDDMEDLYAALDNLQDAIDAQNEPDVINWVNQLNEYVEAIHGKVTGSF